MLNNKQRAHNLAIAILPQLIGIKYLGSKPDDSSENNIVIDYFKEYIEIYNVALKNFNNNFPD